MSRRGFRFTPAPERRARLARHNEGATVYHQLLALGFTPEDIAAEVADADTRRIALSLEKQEGTDTPIVGVAYGGDFRAEEEWGIPEIHKGLAAGEGDKRVFSGEKDGVWYLGIHADGRMGSWRDEEAIPTRVDTAIRRSRDEARDEHWRDRYLKVAELRQGIRDAGHTGPLPRKKDELLAVFTEVVRKTHPLSNVGEFHYGDILIMIPARPVIEAVLRIFAGSGKHLRMGGSNSPFGRGATVFDDRDLSAKSVEAARAYLDFVDKANKKAEPMRRALRDKGSLYALSPKKTDAGGNAMYWLNFSPRGHRQQFGWYTLAQLAERLRKDDWPAPS